MPKPMSEGQVAYETRRAARAGMSLEKWLESKEKKTRAREVAAASAPPAPKKPGLFSRLMEKAQKPL